MRYQIIFNSRHNHKNTNTYMQSPTTIHGTIKRLTTIHKIQRLKLKHYAAYSRGNGYALALFFCGTPTSSDQRTTSSMKPRLRCAVAKNISLISQLIQANFGSFGLFQSYFRIKIVYFRVKSQAPFAKSRIPENIEALLSSSLDPRAIL